MEPTRPCFIELTNVFIFKAVKNEISKDKEMINGQDNRSVSHPYLIVRYCCTRHPNPILYPTNMSITM